MRSALEADDLLPVDRVGDRLADPLVVERLHRHVEMQLAELGRPQHVDDHAGLLLESLDPLLVLPAVDDVELARGEREVARRVGRDQVVDDAVDLRRAAEVVLVGDEDHAFVRLVRLEPERTGADRVEAEVVAELLDRLPADDVAAVVVGDEAEEERHRLLQLDANRQRIDRLDGVDRRVVGRERRGLRVGGALEREDDVVGGQGSVVAVELDALSQVEGPGQLVGRAFPASPRDRARASPGSPSRAKAHQAVVDPRGQRLVLRRRRAVRIELVDVGGRHADVEGRLGVGAGRSQEECRCGGAEMSLHAGSLEKASSRSRREPARGIIARARRIQTP